MTIHILIFWIFSFVGWALEVGHSFLVSGTFIPSGYFKGLPFSTIYGIGGVLMISLFIRLRKYPSLLVILITTFVLIFLEYISGWFCIFFLGEMLWSYLNEPYNLHGHICLLNSFYWLLLVTFFYFCTRPFTKKFSVWVRGFQRKISRYDLYITILFFVLLIGLTLYNRDLRLEIFPLSILEFPKNIFRR